MGYEKMLDDSKVYIVGIGKNCGGVPISEEQYFELLQIIRNHARWEAENPAPEGFAYRLRADTLEYELCAAPPVPPEEAASEDYQEALEVFGV